MIKLTTHIAADTNLPALLPEVLPDTASTTETEHFPGEGYRVLLFNDEDHSMEEVIMQIVKAIKCDSSVAVAIMAKAHLTGHAVVTITDQDEAERVANVLREIQLRVSVEAV